MILPDQPPPTPGIGDAWAEIIAHPMPARLRAVCAERRQIGIARYGTPLQRGNGRANPVDLMQELLDGAAYAWVLGWWPMTIVLLFLAWVTLLWGRL